MAVLKIDANMHLSHSLCNIYIHNQIVYSTSFGTITQGFIVPTRHGESTIFKRYFVQLCLSAFYSMLLLLFYRLQTDEEKVSPYIMLSNLGTDRNLDPTLEKQHESGEGQYEYDISVKNT